MFLFLFVVVPLVELILLGKLSGAVGFFSTVMIVVVTGMLGARLARSQGTQAWLRIQKEFEAGRLPKAELVDGLMVLVAGVLLVTPGVLTDLTGFAFLLPPIRALVRPFLVRWAQSRVRAKSPGQRTQNPFSQGFGNAEGRRPAESAPQKERVVDPFRRQAKGPIVDAEIIQDADTDAP